MKLIIAKIILGTFYTLLGLAAVGALALAVWGIYQTTGWAFFALIGAMVLLVAIGAGLSKLFRWAEATVVKEGKR